MGRGVHFLHVTLVQDGLGPTTLFLVFGGTLHSGCGELCCRSWGCSGSRPLAPPQGTRWNLPTLVANLASFRRRYHSEQGWFELGVNVNTTSQTRQISAEGSRLISNLREDFSPLAIGACATLVVNAARGESRASIFPQAGSL